MRFSAASRVDEAYVLRTHLLGEADLIVTLLAEHAGRVKGVARSARRSRKRFGGALEPLTRVSARWTEKEGRELHQLESLELLQSYAPLQADPVFQATCAVLAEIAISVSREDQPDAKSFRLLGAVLDALEAGLDRSVALRYFEYWTLRLHGLLPDLGVCGGCDRSLSPGARRLMNPGSGVYCPCCASRHGVSGKGPGKADLEFLSCAASRPPTAMGEHVRAARSGGTLERLLRGTLEVFVERAFRTYRHLELVVPDRRPGSAGS